MSVILSFCIYGYSVLHHPLIQENVYTLPTPLIYSFNKTISNKHHLKVRLTASIKFV